MRPDILRIQKAIHRAVVAINAKRTSGWFERYESLRAASFIALDPQRIKAASKRTSAMHPASGAFERGTCTVIVKF
jgi:hypothetical protein